MCVKLSTSSINILIPFYRKLCMFNKSRVIIESIRKLSESRKFHNDTKIRDFGNSKSTSYGTWPEAWKRIYYKAYPRLDQVFLPKPSKKLFDMEKVLRQRVSCREFSEKAVKPSKFGDMLYYSAGLKNFKKKGVQPRRFYPSAGARYPLEVYPFIFNVEKIKSAVYHYHLKTHSLELILNKPFFTHTMRQFSQPWLRKSAALLVISAIFDRTENKYKDRGYRHILTEYGHLAQNFYLMSTALNLGCCSIGGFIDDGLNEILDIDGIEESVVGVIAVGNRAVSGKIMIDY